MKTILITVSGMSPAIITETVWALATEEPPVIPDEVIVITTLKGETDIQRLLLDPANGWKGASVWDTLRTSVFKECKISPDNRKLQMSIRVIDLPGNAGVRVKAADIRSREENAEAADFILNTLSPHAIAEDCHVIASIAGGRKTMGALLYGAMTLVAKETDRVTHVLVNEPYEMCRTFFYPAQPLKKLEAGPPGKTVTVDASKALIELADLPFVPLRNGFHDLGEGKLGFQGLVHRYSTELKRSTDQKPVIFLDSKKSILTVNGVSIRLTGRELLVVMFLYKRAEVDKPLFQSHAVAFEPFENFFTALKVALPKHKAVSGFESPLLTSTLTQGLSSLRTKLKIKGLAHTIPYLVPGRGHVGFNAECS